MRQSLENKLEADLKLAAVLRGRLIPRPEIWKFTGQFAVAVGICHYRNIVESDDAARIEKILEFAEGFEFVTLGQIKEARIAQISVKLRRSFPRIALDADRSVRNRRAVAVDVGSRNDIECFAAVGGGDDADLVVIEKIAEHFV